MRGHDFADLLAAGDMGVQDRPDVTVQFRRCAFGFRLDLGAEISAFLLVDFDQSSAERQLHALVIPQARGAVCAGVADAIGKACRIERGFGGAGAGMRARDESRITGESNPSKHHPCRSQIVDRLKERRGPRKNLRDLGCDQRFGISFHAGDDVGPDQRRRNAGGMVPAVGVGANVGEGDRIGRPVPDNVIGAAADGRIVVPSGTA